MFHKGKLAKQTINPDEIFVDAKNIPDFDRYQFEGRLEKPIAKPAFFGISACFLLLGALLLVKSAHLQIIKGESYSSRAMQNYLRPIVISPNRGIIYDRNGKELAWNDLVNEGENLKQIRAYTDIPGLAHILGYTGIGQGGRTIGKDGIEKKEEAFLGGTAGVKLVEYDSKNEVKSESISRTPASGKSLKLTIDAELQSKLYGIIADVVEEKGFGGGAGVILDINSGEILSMTSYPEYDSQILSRGKPEADIKKYLENSKMPFFNRAISGLYAPGSIIKPLVALAALNEKIITPEKQILSTGSISVPNPFFPDKPNIFKDWKAHGWVDMRRALAVSSNVYFYTVGGGYEGVKGLGIGKLKKYAEFFGFGSKTNVNLDKEEEGLIPSPETKAILNQRDPVWRIGDTYNASIGQGDFQITPLQAAVYAASIANEGRVLQPRLVTKEGEDYAAEEKIIDIPSGYFKIVKEGMRQVVLEGTGQGLSGLSVEIAAKTGTAELESNANKFVNSWLIGFFPYKNPRFAFSILLEKGKVSNLVGGVFVARQLFDWMIIHTPEYLTAED